MPAGTATNAFLLAESARIADACTACGDCVRACPMTDYAPETLAEPSATVHGIIDLLRGGPSTSAALRFVALCTRSGLCTPACPEEPFDPAFMMRLAKLRAFGALGDAVRIPVKEDAQFSPRVKAFARLTMTEEEQAQWL